MDDNQQDGSEVLETTETDAAAAETTEVEETVELTAAEAKELREKAAKTDDLEKKNKQLFERAKKATAKAEEAPGISKDTIALVAAGITDSGDIEEVVEFASYRKISIAEALNNKTLKSILSERADERKTAAATSTRSARGGSQVSGEALIEKARSGDAVPEGQIEALVAARIGAQKAKLGK
jgi:hypothetical protein